jgi:hypothetical protein
MRAAVSDFFLVGELVGAPAGGEVADRLLGQAGLTGDR